MPAYYVEIASERFSDKVEASSPKEAAEKFADRRYGTPIRVKEDASDRTGTVFLSDGSGGTL